MAVSAGLDVTQLRRAIQAEYAEVAVCPTKGFHFHTGRAAAERLGYRGDDLDWLPSTSLDSFAGVGNPFVLGALRPGESVLDVGSGAGTDSLIAARQVGPRGRVVGVDMTDAMLEKARAGARQAGLRNLELRAGLAEALPLPDGEVDVVISNGAINLCPDKEVVYREIARVLKPGGRVQIADIVVGRAVPSEAKEDIGLWTG